MAELSVDEDVFDLAYRFLRDEGEVDIFEQEALAKAIQETIEEHFRFRKGKDSG